MKYQVALNAENQLTIVSGFAGKLSVFINGAPVQHQNGNYYIPMNNETKVLTVKRGLIDNTPRVTLDGQEVLLAKKLKAYEWVFSLLPLLIVILGGALGGFFGVIAFLFNTKLFRTELPVAAKIPLSLLITALAVVLYFIIAGMLLTVLRT